mgnify:CR=1 FL=1
MGRLTDILGAFAEGYISERGVSGTLEDVGNLASGLLGLADGDNSDDDTSDFVRQAYQEMIDALNDYIDNGEFEEALSRLEEYYDVYENSQYDFRYYYIKARIYLAWYKTLSYNNEILATIKAKLLDSLTDSKKRSIGDEELRSEVMEVESEFRSAERWNHLLGSFFDDCEFGISTKDSSVFRRAKKRLDEYYSKYENDIYDSAYYYLLLILYMDWLCVVSEGNQDGYEDVLTSSEEALSLLRQNDKDDSFKDFIIQSEDRLKGIKQSHSKCGLSIPSEQNELVVDNTCLSEVEQKYLDEILFCLEEDNCFTETERKYLERIRIKLGLSKERAEEIEAVARPQLTQEEQEYLGIFKEMMEDGVISERVRHILDRKQRALGITPDRAKELEQL